MGTKVGDTIIIPRYGGTEIELEEEVYHIFRDGNEGWRYHHYSKVWRNRNRIGGGSLPYIQGWERRLAIPSLFQGMAEQKSNWRRKSTIYSGMGTKVGDTIIIPRYGGTEIELEEEVYHIFRD